MKVSRDQLLEDGYLILREVIPPAQLDGLRANVETLIDRQRVIWARNRKPEDPPGGLWETHKQPRVMFDQVVDPATSDVIDFFRHENTLGVSEQLVRGREAAPIVLWVMCSPPARDYGPDVWHRDIGPHKEPPLRGLQSDLLENGPGVVQWNVPLYDDDVLWVVPGSHRRVNSEEENRSLLANPRAPVPGGMPVKLRAGDGVVYLNAILHWGSNYSTRLRRTLHFGYRSFEGPIFPYVFDRYWDPASTERVAPATAAAFQHFGALWSREWDLIESIFRAMIDRDANAARSVDVP